MVELSLNCFLPDSGLRYFSVNRHKAKSTTQYQITHTHAHWLPLWLLPICLPVGRTLINHCRHNQTCWLTTHGCTACAHVSCTHVGFCVFPVHLCVCEWVDGRLELTQHDFSADLMRETAKKAAGVLWCVTNQNGWPIESHETQLVLFTAWPQRVHCLYQGYSYMGSIFVLLSFSKWRLT